MYLALNTRKLGVITRDVRSDVIIIFIYLSWSWATCWPVPVSRIQKSLQRSTMLPSASNVTSRNTPCRHLVGGSNERHEMMTMVSRSRGTSRVQKLRNARCYRGRGSLQMSHTLKFGRPYSMDITGGKARGQQIGILLGYSKFRLDRITSCNYERDRVPYSANLVCFSSLLRLLFSTAEHIVRYKLSCLYWYEFTSV